MMKLKLVGGAFYELPTNDEDRSFAADYSFVFCQRLLCHFKARVGLESPEGYRKGRSSNS